jgi:hypothetical protein
VLTDGATQRLADSAIGFADAGEHELKGKAEPQRLWRATRMLAGVGGSQRVDGLEAPLIGRDAELRTVRELFHAVAERRVPRLVLVSGPAGVGKSRLGWEFRKYTDGLADDVWWHQGRCLSYGDGVAFWALAQMVRQRLSIAEDDPAEAAASKLADGLDRYIPDPGERAYAGARLGRLLGVAVAGDGGRPLAREELFAGWRLFFERLAAEHPVVLLVEDAQHADVGLLDLLDYLIDWVRDLPVYVLVFARPELGQARPGFGAGRNRTTLTLDPLDAASMDMLVDALVPGMPAPARAKITGHAQGIRARPGPRPPHRQRRRSGRRRGVRRRDRRAARALHPLPPGARVARPRHLPATHGRGRGRRGRDRRSRRHRGPAGLSAAARPREHHPARAAPHRRLVMRAAASRGRS